MEKNINYEQAMKELEAIVTKMESDELDLDAMSEQLKRAQSLIKTCRDKLTKTEEDIKRILATEA